MLTNNTQRKILYLNVLARATGVARGKTQNEVSWTGLTFNVSRVFLQNKEVISSSPWSMRRPSHTWLATSNQTKTYIPRFNHTYSKTFHNCRRQNRSLVKSIEFMRVPPNMKWKKVSLPLLFKCLISNSKKKSGDSQGEKHKTSREFRPQCMKRTGAP